MIRVLAPAVVTAGLIAGVAVGLPAAQSSEPPVVVLDTVVSDINGIPAHGLTADDFEVVSESRPQTISFVSAEPQPLSVVFLIDVSSSASEFWRPSVASVASALGGALRAGDRARFAGVAARVTFGPWSADSAALLQTAATALTPGRDDAFGPSPIWDAVDTTLEALASEPGRRTIVLLTDGRASGNVHGLDEVRARAAALGVPVNVFAAWTGVTDAAGNLLRQLTATSGGLAVAYSSGPATVSINGKPRAIRGTPASSLAPLAERVLSDLRTCYRVGFVPARSDGAVHAVSVVVKKPGYKARTRDRFVAGSPR